MADPKHINRWMDRLDIMGWFQAKLDARQHADRRAMYADALAAMSAERLDDACREWLKVGRHYPSPAELWEIASAAERGRQHALPPPEHRPFSSSAAKPVIHDPAGTAAQVVRLKSSGQAYDRIAGSIGEAMLERAGYGHLLSGLEAAE